LDPIKDKILGLGINALEVDGHNLSDLISAFEKSKKIRELNCILAKTVKGKGSSLMENKKDWHYWNAMSEEEIEKTRKELA
jgi:transketolase